MISSPSSTVELPAYGPFAEIGHAGKMAVRFGQGHDFEQTHKVQPGNSGGPHLPSESAWGLRGAGTRCQDDVRVAAWKDTRAKTVDRGWPKPETHHLPNPEGQGSRNQARPTLLNLAQKAPRVQTMGAVNLSVSWSVSVS